MLVTAGVLLVSDGVQAGDVAEYRAQRWAPLEIPWEGEKPWFLSELTLVP